jgi:hypothetical protein
MALFMDKKFCFLNRKQGQTKRVKPKNIELKKNRVLTTNIYFFLLTPLFGLAILTDSGRLSGLKRRRADYY